MSNTTSVLIYLSTYLVSALLLQCAAKASRKWIQVCLFLFALLPPCLLAGLRYQVGTDYANYLSMFKGSADLTFADYLRSDNVYGFGVYLLGRIAGVFDSSEVYFFLFAVVIYAPVAWRIMEKKDTEPVAILAWLFLLSSFTGGLNIARQTAAASICFFALKYVYEGKFWKYAITILFATAFHISAVVFLPIYYAWYRQQEVRNFHFRAWVIIIAYVVIVLNFSAIVGLLGERYSGYGNQDIQGRGRSILFDLIWLVIFLIFNKTIVRNDPKSGLLIVMELVGNILGLTGLRNTFAKRIGLYFTYPNFILLPQLRYGFTRRSRPIVLLMVLIYSVVLFVITYVVLGHADIVPYRFVFGIE